MLKNVSIKQLCLLLLFGFVFNIPSAFAFEKQFVENTPLKGDFPLGTDKVDLTVRPGDTYTKELTITNRLGRDATFKVEVEDFTGSYNTDETTVLLGDKKSPFSLRDFIKPEVNEFTLKHGERIVLPVKIDIPRNAEPGGLYAAVLISTNSGEKREADGAVTQLISRVGSLFLVRVDGETQERGSLREFTVESATGNGNIYEKTPVNLALVFQNEGNVHLLSYGKIEISNLLGKKVDEIPIDPFYSMPQSARKVKVVWKNDMAFGLYKAKLDLTTDLKYQKEQSQESRTLEFWIVPWKPLVLGFLALIALVLILKKFLGNFRVVKRQV